MRPLPRATVIWHTGGHSDQLRPRIDSHTLCLPTLPPCSSLSLLSSAQLDEAQSLKTFFPSSLSKGSPHGFKGSTRSDFSAERLGGILKIQYWFLQGTALPKANGGPSEHFRDCSHNHPSCWSPYPNTPLQPITTKPLVHASSYQREDNGIFVVVPVTHASKLRTLVLWLHNRQPADIPILKHYFFRVYRKSF